jgi:hypothetical protein
MHDHRDVVTIGPHNFEHVTYFAGGDVLYLRKVAGTGGAGEETPEGHAFFYPLEGGDEVIGADILYPREILKQEGRLEITLPDGELVEIQGFEEAMRTTQP